MRSLCQLSDDVRVRKMIHGRSRLQWGLLLILTALLGLFGAAVVGAEPARQDGVTVALEPAQITRPAGDPFDVNVVINGVKDLGAFQITLKYDPALVQVDKATFGKFIGSTDRSVVQLDPRVDPAAGQVVVGAATVGAQPGASGKGILLTLSFTAMQAGQGELALAQVLLTDTKAALISATAVGSKIDFTGSIVVPTATQAPATPIATLAPSPTVYATLTTAPTATSELVATPEPAATELSSAAASATPSETQEPIETLVVRALRERPRPGAPLRPWGRRFRSGLPLLRGRRLRRLRATPTGTPAAETTPVTPVETTVPAPGKEATPVLGAAVSPTPTPAPLRAGGSAGPFLIVGGLVVAAVAIFLWWRGRRKGV